MPVPRPSATSEESEGWGRSHGRPQFRHDLCRDNRGGGVSYYTWETASPTERARCRRAQLAVLVEEKSTASSGYHQQRQLGLPPGDLGDPSGFAHAAAVGRAHPRGCVR